MTYNVQSLFDDNDDGTEYDEFDPSSGNWNRDLFLEKVFKVSRVIKESVAHGPDIVALQEIENINTMEILCKKGLTGMGYSYRILVPTEGSATNTAILSRVAIRCVKAYCVGEFSGIPLRSIVEVEVVVNNGILYLFNNHWKSKLGGEYETEVLRRKAASIIITRVNEILYNDPLADIVVLGDLNENTAEYLEHGCTYQTALIPLSVNVPGDYNDESLFLTNNPGTSPVPGGPVVFFEPWYDPDITEKGSSVYKNRWQTPDHILLSHGLFHKKGYMYEKGSFQVMNSSFLLDPITGYPDPWEYGNQSHGYSDHLPLLISIDVP